MKRLLLLMLVCAAANAQLREAETLQKAGLYKEANNAYRLALQQNPKSVDIRVKWGRLFLLAYNEDEASKLFEEALAIEPHNPGALTGEAEVLSDHWDAGASKLVEDALADDPKYIPAIVLKIKHALEDEKFADAQASIARGLEINPDSLEVLAMNAALAYQRGNAADTNARIDAVLKRDAHNGDVYVTLAHFAQLHRQFAEARDYLTLATKKNPTLWKAYAELGITNLRLGDDAGARAALETAYKGDPFNPWTVNSLRLMDSYKNLVQYETPDFRVKLGNKEVDVMRPYVDELLERAYTTYQKEYKFTPPEKTSFEMFPDHEDFAVRTVGVAGLGALGASFGKIVAMDSPASRPTGDFHWGSTLWHEVAHVFTLQSSNNRVPRWVTEGLSVYEEWHAGWGDRIDLETIQNLQKSRLLTIADLNRGFLRPMYNGEVQFAYWEAGMLCRYIVEKYGFDKILAMLAAYKDGEENIPALERVVGRKSTELDTEFRAWLDKKMSPLVAAMDFEWTGKAGAGKSRAELEAEVKLHPKNFFAHIHLAQMLVAEKDLDAALPHALAAEGLFPDFTGTGNAYEIAAGIYNVKGDKELAAREMLAWVKAGGWNVGTGENTARMLTELHREPEAIKVLEGFLYIAPQNPELHTQLAALYLDAQRAEPAIREYSVALAMKPLDLASAHYNLARAYAAAKRTTEAKRQLIDALEVAPNFSPAQKLLIQLTDNEGKS